MRSFDRNIGLNFWFYYEKIFELPDLSEECNKNQLDLTRTLDTYNFEEEEDSNDEPKVILQFK